MQISLTNFEKNTNDTHEVKEIPQEFINAIDRNNLSDFQIQKHLNNLSISADQKVLINKVLNFTVETGKQIIKVGKRIIELTLLFIKKFPASSFGLVFGLVVASFIPSGNIAGFAIPIVSSLSSLIKKIIVVFAVVIGFKEDLKNTALGVQISNATLNMRNALEKYNEPKQKV
jgi:hypothetical protein|tara:strand:+ start:103 stop:621 length:519 start_codon:yes stop_codon:yes gene_type:complete